MARALSRRQREFPLNCGSFTSSPFRKYSTPPPPSKAIETNTAISPRWLTDTKTRIGKCIMFGMPAPLVDEASTILSELGSNWRDLVVGSQGYITSPKRAGLDRVPIQWGDQDTMGHVNNVQYVRWCETGRTNWTRNYGKYFDVANRRGWEELLTNRGVGLILKSITVDYKFPMTWPDRISVYHKLRDRPGKETESMLLDVLILSEAKQRPAAKALEDVAVYDYRKGKKSPLTPFMLDQFMETWELQEEAKRVNREKVESIEKRVRRLEEETWNRPDAKEDFGGPV